MKKKYDISIHGCGTQGEILNLLNYVVKALPSESRDIAQPFYFSAGELRAKITLAEGEVRLEA